MTVYSNDEYIGIVRNEKAGDAACPAGYPAKAITVFDLISDTDIPSTLYADNILFYYAK